MSQVRELNAHPPGNRGTRQFNTGAKLSLLMSLHSESHFRDSCLLMLNNNWETSNQMLRYNLLC